MGPAPAARLRCHGCEREFPEDKWFARIRLGRQWEDFCSPYCVELFFALRTAERCEPEPERNPERLAEAVRETARMEAGGATPQFYGPVDLAQAVWAAAGRRVVTQ